MAIEKSSRRLPLRDLLIVAEKHTRDLIEKVGSDWLKTIADLRNLSRPVRKRSPFPTLVALHHAMENTLKSQDELAEMMELLTHELEDIRDHARREKLNRK